MASSYSLQDTTSGRYLFDSGGSGVAALAGFMDRSGAGAPPLTIFTLWDYYGHGAADPPPAPPISAAAVVRDMDRLIEALAGLAPQTRFGAATAPEWIAIFREIRTHAAANPGHEFRSTFVA